MAKIIFGKFTGLQDSIYGKSEAPIKAFLEETAKSYEDSSLIDNVFKVVESSNYAEKFTGLTGHAQGFLPVGEGGAYPGDERQETYSKVLEADTWKDSFTITQEMIEDSKILDMNRIGASGFLEAYHLTREKYGAQLLIGAVSGTSTTFRGKAMDCTSNDGVSLFSTSHPSKTGNTSVQSNKFAGAIDADVLGQIETKMQNFTDDNGEILTVSPDTIVIPNDAGLKKLVFAAIGAEKEPETANNGYNYQHGRWNVLVSPYLNPLIGSDKPYFIFDSKYNKGHDCLLMVERIPLTVSSYVDDNTDNNVWKGRARFVCGVNDWRAISVGGVTGGTSLE